MSKAWTDCTNLQGRLHPAGGTVILLFYNKITVPNKTKVSLIFPILASFVELSS